MKTLKRKPSIKLPIKQKNDLKTNQTHEYQSQNTKCSHKNKKPKKTKAGKIRIVFWVLATTVLLPVAIYLAQLIFENSISHVVRKNPIIDAGSPSYGEILKEPFSIKNPNKYYGLKNIRYVCLLDEIDYENRISLTNSDAKNIKTIFSIKPSKNANIRCENLTAYSIFGPRVVRAKIRFRLIFEHTLSRFTFKREQMTSETFTYDGFSNPPRWIKGPIH